MPTPLNKLTGAELLPQEIKIVDEWKKCAPSYQSGYNEAVDDLGMCAIIIDEDQVVEIIKKISPYSDLREISKCLATKQEKFLKIVRVNDEVKS